MFGSALRSVACLCATFFLFSGAAQLPLSRRLLLSVVDGTRELQLFRSGGHAMFIYTKGAASRWCIVAVVGLWLSFVAERANAIVRTWDGEGGANTAFGNSPNWDPNGVPNVGDTAVFNLPGTFLVTFGGNHFSDVLQVQAGTVTMRSASAFTRTYDLTTGGADVSITGASTIFNLGAAGMLVNMNIGDDLSVNSGGTFNINFGTNVTTADLILGTSGSGLTNSIVVDGSGSTLARTGITNMTMGQNGATGILTFRNSAQGDLAGPLTVASSLTATSTAVVNVESGATLDLRNLNIGTGTSSAATGTVTVTGDNSSITQLGAATLTLGSASGNIGNLNVESDGTFTTGTGTTTVNATGSIDIGTGFSGGTFNANGNVNVNGGSIFRGSGNFNLASGRTLTATNDAQINLGISTVLSGGTTWNIESGASLFSSGIMDIGLSGGSTMVTIDGADSSLETGSNNSLWGTGGHTAQVTVSNGASANVGGIFLAGSSTAGTTGILTVESGATMTTGSLSVADIGGTTTSGEITVTGSGFTLTQTGTSALTIGHATNGSATLDVLSGGGFTTGTGGVTLNATGTINLDGGTFNLNGAVNNNGGAFNFNAGVLNVANDFLIGAGGLLGATPSLGSGTTLNVTNTTTIDPTAVLTLSGGNLYSANVIIDGGTVEMGSGTTLNVTNTTTIDPAAMLTISGGSLISANMIIGGGTVDWVSGIFLSGSTDLTVQSGGTLDINENTFSSTATRPVTVTGPGSQIIGTPSSRIWSSDGEIEINDGGSLNVGRLIIQESGMVIVDGATTIMDIAQLGGATLPTTIETGGALIVQNEATANFGATLNVRGGGNVIVQSGASLNVVTSDLLIGTESTGAGTATVTGEGSTITAGVVTVGASSIFGGGPTGTMNIDDAGKLIVGDTLRVHQESEVNVNGGTLEANSNVIIQGSTVTTGGKLQVSQDGEFNLAAGQSLSASTNAQIIFGGNYNIDDATVFTISSGADFSVAALGIGDSGTDGTLRVNGSGSTVIQSDDSTLTVGHASSGIATLNIGTITSGGQYATGTGLTTINNTGTINIGSGTNTGLLNAKGDVLINGGILARGSGSTFTLASGKTMTIQNGGQASFTGDYLTAANATYTITGTSSGLETSGAFRIRSGAKVNVSFGGTIDSASLDVASSGAGTLEIEAGGSASSSTGLIGFNTGATGTVTVTGEGSAWTNTSSLLVGSEGRGTLTIEDGGSVFSMSSQISYNNFVDPNVTSEVSVRGTGSIWTNNTVLDIGNAGGNGRLRIEDGGRVMNGIGNVVGGLVLPTTVTGPGSTWDNSGDLSVGVGNSGALRIEASGSVSNMNGTIALGSVIVTGAGSTWTNNHNLVLTGPGTLTIEAGGSAANAIGTIGLDSDSTSNVTVSGTSSTWTNNGDLMVGDSGMGLLTIEAGGSVSNSNGTVGAGAGSTGTVTVTGAGSIWTNNGDLTVGSMGTASLTMIDGGEVVVAGSLASNAANNVRLLGGKLTVDQFGAGGFDALDWRSGSLRLTGGSGLTIGTGGLFGASLALNAGKNLEVNNILTIDSGAELFVSGGLSAGSLINNGDLILSSTTVNGSVTNAAGANITAIGDVTFNGLASGPGGFFGPGTITFAGGMAPGASPALVSFEGSIALASTNTLFIELGGSEQGTQYDSLQVAGTAVLAGTLDVSLLNFAPSASDAFEIITAAGGISGTFIDTILPALGGNLSWNLDYGASSVMLTVVAPGLPGDYNADGVVNAADYVVWRDHLGSATSLPNDSTPGVEASDYSVWQGNFGNTAGNGAGVLADVALAAVPEPTTLMLLIFSAVGWHLWRRRAA